MFESEGNEIDISYDTVQSNPYIYLLRDAVLALSVAANVSMMSSQSDNNLFSKYIYIYQIVNGISANVGVYNRNSKNLENLTIGT